MKAGKESFSNKPGVTRKNKTGPESGLELDLLFLFARERNDTFANLSDFWFTFHYCPISGFKYSESLLPYPCECNAIAPM